MKHKKHEEKEDKKESNGLTPAQKKLPPKLQAAILKSKGKSKKHMDADDEGDNIKNKEKADLDNDGKLSSYEKARGEAIESSMKKEKGCSCGCDDPKDCTCDDKNENNWSGRSLPTFQEWLEWRDNQN